MLKKFGKLWKDRRGNALLIAGFAMPMLVGAAGLATDTVQWALWKRQLQRAADSAAFAGTYASAAGNSVPNAVSLDLQRNNKVGIALLSAPSIAYPANTAQYTNAVQVTISVKKDLTFASFFMKNQPTITTTATAGMIDIGEYCVRALRKDSTPGIVISGNTTTNLGCRAQSNSRHSTNSVNPNGASYVFNATAVAGVGGLPSSITGTTKLIPHSMELADPFAGKYPTDIPSSAGTCQNFNQMDIPSLSTTTGSGTSRVVTRVMKPGCYNSFAPNGQDIYMLKSGTYYLNSTDFKLAGQDTLMVYPDPGEANPGVTIILTGSTPGSLAINGTATVNLYAPTSGTYANMLFIQSSSATTDNNNILNGSATTTYNGGVYFPRGQVTMNGTAGNQTRCLMIVGYTVKFAGNANVQNDKTGCKTPPPQSGKSIRLLA